MKGILYYIHALKMHNNMSISNARFNETIVFNDLNILFQNHKYCGIIGTVPLVRYFYNNEIITKYLIDHGYIYPNIVKLSRVAFSYFTQGAILKHVLQPTQLVLSAMQSIFPNYQNQQFIGIHLRTGGKLSDTPISQVFLNKNALKNVMPQVIGIQYTQKNVLLYLSTDSSFVRNFMQTSLQPNRLIMKNQSVVIVDSQYNTSHHSDQILSAVADLMLLGNSKACYGTYGSTFSHVGCGMSGHRMEIVGRKYSQFKPLPDSYTEF